MMTPRLQRNEILCVRVLAEGLQEAQEKTSRILESVYPFTPRSLLVADLPVVLDDEEEEDLL
jgi:hypothetical protein